MRPILIDDALSASAALMVVPAGHRPWVLCRMLAEADAADRLYRATGRPHPLWGEGSLMAAARRRRRAARLDLEQPETCDVLALVWSLLAARHRNVRRLPVPQVPRGMGSIG